MLRHRHLALGLVLFRSTTSAFVHHSRSSRAHVHVSSALLASQQPQPNLDDLLVPQLKDLLRSNGLKVGGRKAELIERLELHYSTSSSSTAIPNNTAASATMPKTKKSSSATAAAAEPKAKKAKKAKAPDHQRQTERTEIPKLWDGDAATKESGSYTLKIASWNVAGLRALLKNHPKALPTLAEKYDLDVICLQETKLQEVHVSDEKLKIGVGEERVLHAEGYEGHWSCSTVKKGYSGTAVFVRRRGDGGGESRKKQASLSSFFKSGGSNGKEGAAADSSTSNSRTFGKVDVNRLIPTVSYGIGPNHDGEGRSITLDFPDFSMTNLYVPNSGQKLDRLEYRTEKWDKDILEFMQQKESERKCPVLWLGDLNVAHTAKDTWNEGAKHLKKSAGTTPEERASFEQQLEAGYVDAFRKLHPEALGHYSYWSQRAGNREPNKGLRLDYFICSEKMMEDKDDSRVVVRDSYMIPDQKGSDHCPLLLELEIKA